MTTTIGSALFVASVLICLGMSGNFTIFMQMQVEIEQLRLSADFHALCIYAVGAAVCALLVDRELIVRMFWDPRIVNGKSVSNVFISVFELKDHVRMLVFMYVVANWSAMHGIIMSVLWLLAKSPIQQYDSLRFDTSVPFDLMSGDLKLNPFLREYHWQSAYGCGCAVYLATVFGASVAWKAFSERSNQGYLQLGWFAMFNMVYMVFSGFFAPGRRLYSAMMVLFTVSMISFIYLRMKFFQSEGPKSPKRRISWSEIGDGPKPWDLVDKWYHFAGTYRRYKPVTVFSLAAALSLLHQYFFTTLYPVAMIFVTYYHIRSHPLNRRWNAVLFVLTVVHQMLHHFTDSYYTLDDQPVLWLDKLCHWFYAVVAIQQWREASEMLSRDPALKFANYVSMFVWLPGGIVALYVAGYYGPSPYYHKFMQKIGGYCLSTGTAMAYCNRDYEEDNETDAPRVEVMCQPGVSAHGVQIFVAFAFAVVYIVSAGGKKWMADMLEYDWDYAAHLYTAYGAL